MNGIEKDSLDLFISDSFHRHILTPFPPCLPPTTGRKLHFKFGGTVMKIGTEFYDPSGREIAASLIKMSALIKFYLFWAAGAGAQAVAVRNNEDLNGSS